MRILIVSEHIAPLRTVASIRWTKIAKYIKKKHPEAHVTILTNQKDYTQFTSAINPREKDCMLERDMIYFDKYLEIPYGLFWRLFYRLKKLLSMENKIKRLSAEKYTIENKKNSIKVTLFSFLYDFKNILLGKKAWRYIKKNNMDYDVVFSSYGPFWPHLVAEKIKKQNSHIVWVSDFRDPYAGDSDPSCIYELHQKMAMKHCAYADMVLRVNDELQTFTHPNIPLHKITNGFDPEEKIMANSPKKFSLVFTGSLYGNRTDLGLVCKVISELSQEERMVEDDVEVIYAGSFENTAQSLAESYHSERFLHNYGVLPREKSLELQQNAAILLNLDWNTKQERCLWGGKIYEYMMMQKPMLCVITGDEPYSNASKNIHYLGGYCYEQCRHEETYQGMKDYILEKYQEWKATGNVTVQQDKDYVEQFAYPHIAEQVWQLIQEGMRKRNESGTVKEN